MKFVMEYPILSDVDGGAWIEPANIAELARVAESAGLDALAFTDHPAPSRKWLDGGGHETFDPFVALSYVAAVTTTLRVMTYLTVVPYRNPLMTARSMATVDRLSGGRATFALGTGYLRSEFAALGVDFEERNALFDEAVDVMRQAWTGDEVRYEGRHFQAHGVVITPGPVQKPHPPLWLGGNASVVRERVASWGQGWAPLLGGPTLMRTTRTKDIAGRQELAEMIATIGDQMEAGGRDRSQLDVLSGSPEPLPADASVEQQIHAIGELAEIGVTWTHVPPVPRTSFAAALDALSSHQELMAKSR
jgi:probable F420-dependent oxidoreductase